MALKIIHCWMKLKNYAIKAESPVVAVCAKIESEIADLNEDEKLIFLSDLNLTEPGLNRVIRECIHSIGFANIFHSGSQRS